MTAKTGYASLFWDMCNHIVKRNDMLGTSLRALTAANAFGGNYLGHRRGSPPYPAANAAKRKRAVLSDDRVRQYEWRVSRDDWIAYPVNGCRIDPSTPARPVDGSDHCGIDVHQFGANFVGRIRTFGRNCIPHVPYFSAAGSVALHTVDRIYKVQVRLYRFVQVQQHLRKRFDRCLYTVVFRLFDARNAPEHVFHCRRHHH